VARKILSTISHSVGVEARVSVGRDVTSWRQLKITRETYCKEIVVRHYARANNGLLPGDNQGLNTTSTDHDIEMTSEAEEQKLQQMAKVHDFLEMWQGSQNLKATQKESCTQNKQMTAVGYILDTEEIVKESLSNFQHDGAAVFKLFKKSPVPPALSAKNHPEGQTQVRNVR